MDTAALLGTWEFDDSINVTRQVFGADGSYVRDELIPGLTPQPHDEGTWSIDEDGMVRMDVTNEKGTALWRRVNVYVSGDLLLWNAHVPMGDHDGVVGRWSMLGEGGAPGDPSLFSFRQTLDLHADGRAVVTYNELSSTGTYEHNTYDDSVVVSAPPPGYPDDPPEFWPARLVDDAVLECELSRRYTRTTE